MHKKSQELAPVIERELEKNSLKGKVKIMVSGCLGMCAKGPIMIVNPGYTMYGKVTEKDIPEIIKQHLVNKKPVERLVIDEDHLLTGFIGFSATLNFSASR